MIGQCRSHMPMLVADPWRLGPRRRRFKAWKIRVGPDAGEIRDGRNVLRAAAGRSLPALPRLRGGVGVEARRRLLSKGERCGRCGQYADEEMPLHIHVPLPVMIGPCSCLSAI